MGDKQPPLEWFNWSRGGPKLAHFARPLGSETIRRRSLESYERSDIACSHAQEASDEAQTQNWRRSWLSPDHVRAAMSTDGMTLDGPLVAKDERLLTPTPI